MKKGFTIAEILITMGIVAVIAAMTAPAVMNMLPNTSKIKYMNIYNAIITANETMLNDETLYKPEYYLTGNDSLIGEPKCIGLGCTAGTTYPDNSLNTATASAGAGKYGKVLAFIMGIDLDEVTGSGAQIKFTGKDGSDWQVNSTTSTEDSATILNVNITVDISGDKGKNCSYSSSCKNADQFKFKVDTYGAVTPDDDLGKKFLKNATDIHTKEQEE